MKIKKIYKKKSTSLLKWNRCIITNKITNNKPTTCIIADSSFKGGSFIKTQITKKNGNLIEIITHPKICIVCLLYDNKWYFGNYIKPQNLLNQNNTILLLLSKLKNQIT